MWILVYWVIGFNSIATGHIDFTGNGACERARAQIRAQSHDAYAVCVERD